MPKIRVSEILPFTAEQMYNVVVDVESYPKFLPWCGKARVWNKTDTQFMAEMSISFKGMREKFQTLDIIEPNKRIEINLKSGPFQYLVSTWHFHPVGEDRTKIEFYIDFRFSNRMKEMIMGPVFTQVSKQMISAFRKRAIALHRS
jgi:coenzyme Q-binding protein COQ10